MASVTRRAKSIKIFGVPVLNSVPRLRRMKQSNGDLDGISLMLYMELQRSIYVILRRFALWQHHVPLR